MSEFWLTRRYHYLERLASRLPQPILTFLRSRWLLWMDPADGWTFWWSADYRKYTRRERRG